mmetsp:Transcript_6675/g.13480  ORF Transcript_6675/g.13480 Transcript_6675/m.13480 type:complete len:263 (-) Transcript_6675:39-827(-)
MTRFTRPKAHLLCFFFSVINADALVQKTSASRLLKFQPDFKPPLQCAAFSGQEDTGGESQLPSMLRRNFIQSASSILLCSQLSSPSSADVETSLAPHPSEPYIRQPSSKEKFSYIVTPPPSFVPGNKPLKTHLDEINFSSPDVKGYTVGVTVDPVRISSIRQFGTPEEVAARVVTAEVNRDGVFQVTLAKDPVEDKDAGGCYDIEYISEGKRGIKHFTTRIFVRDGFLYVLTVQLKENDIDKTKEKEIMDCVRSFKPLMIST